MAADLQTVPGSLVHVQVTDGVLQAGLGAALWDWLGNGVDVEVGDLEVVVRSAVRAGHLPQLFLLLHMAADRTRGDGHGQDRDVTSSSKATNHAASYSFNLKEFHIKARLKCLIETDEGTVTEPLTKVLTVTVITQSRWTNSQGRTASDTVSSRHSLARSLLDSPSSVTVSHRHTLS